MDNSKLDEREDFDERMMREVGTGCAGAIVFWLVLIILMLCFASCKSVKYVPVIEHKTDTCYITKLKFDSIYVSDSTHIVERNDTVKIERWHTKYKEMQVHDTIYIATHDTIPDPYPVEVVKKVEKELSWWQKMRMKIGSVALVLLFGFVVYQLFRLWRYFHPI